MTHVTNWDEVGERRVDDGAIQASRQDLGRAAGMVGAGVRRERIDPGRRAAPAHAHGGEEAFSFVLRGSGLSWQEGVTHEVGPGDCLLHPAPGPAHTLIAGDEGLEVLVFGPDAQTTGTVEIEGEPGERPSTTIHFSEGIEREVSHGRTHLTWRDIGRRTGSQRTGLRHGTVLPSADGPPPHCHSAEHEIFVILDGSGEVTLGDQEHPLRPGSVIGRPAGTGVPHQLRAGEAGLTFLAWSTREPDDMCWYPRSSKVFLRGLGVVFRVEQVHYWDGEEG